MANTQVVLGFKIKPTRDIKKSAFVHVCNKITADLRSLGRLQGDERVELMTDRQDGGFIFIGGAYDPIHNRKELRIPNPFYGNPPIRFYNNWESSYQNSSNLNLTSMRNGKITRT